MTTEQISPGPKQIVRWDDQVGEPVPGEALKWRIPRDAADHHEVKLLKVTDSTAVAEMDVWVVWAEKHTAEVLGDSLPSGGNPSGGPAPFSHLLPKGKFVRFIFAIEPIEIIAFPSIGEEGPDLRGDCLVNLEGAKKKWDVTRRMKIRYANTPPSPDSQPQITSNDLWVDSAAIAAGLNGALLPSMVVDPLVPMPPSDAPNDDIRTTDKANDPYEISDFGSVVGSFDSMTTVSPEFAMIGSVDVPQFPGIRAEAGVDGEEVRFTTNFEEYVRLEIGAGQWFRVSDFVPWKYESVLKKSGTYFGEAGSSATIDE